MVDVGDRAMAAREVLLEPLCRDDAVSPVPYLLVVRSVLLCRKELLRSPDTQSGVETPNTRFVQPNTN